MSNKQTTSTSQTSNAKSDTIKNESLGSIHDIDSPSLEDAEALASSQLSADDAILQTEMEKMEEEIESLKAQLAQAKEKEARAMADYQNLVRRSQQERIQLFKTASKDFVEGILQPLEYLSLAAEQLNDKGLNMVLAQLWNALKQQGLEEIEVLNKPFDIQKMEAVDTEGAGKQVVKIVRKGYTLNGEVIQFAKVVLG